MKNQHNVITKRRLSRIAAIAAACLMVVVTAAPKAGASTLIAGNLGAGGSYQTGTGNSWANGGTGDTANAVSFTNTTGQAYTLSSIQFADNWFEGIDTLNIQFLEGTDLNSATLLESFTVTAPTMYDSYLYTVTSALKPVLLPGETYFIAQSVVDPMGGTTWGWQYNDTGQMGYYAKIGSAPWFTESDVTPAFAVYGSPVSPAITPEPSSLLLFGTGLAMAAVRVAKRLRRS